MTTRLGEHSLTIGHRPNVTISNHRNSLDGFDDFPNSRPIHNPTKSLFTSSTMDRDCGHANLFKLDGNQLNRAGPRMVAGATALCESLELARQHRKNQP